MLTASEKYFSSETVCDVVFSDGVTDFELPAGTEVLVSTTLFDSDATSFPVTLGADCTYRARVSRSAIAPLTI